MPPRFKAEQTEQKLRGGYYTPQKYTDYISHWVMQQRPKRVLEPSCGDGAFLRSLIKLNADQFTRLHAIEIDPLEAGKALMVLDQQPGQHHIQRRDFLGFARQHIQQNKPGFNAVVGNPPYIRYQFLGPDFQTQAQHLMSALGLNFTKLANAWVIFVIACIAMLEKGGRLGMVIPSEVLHVLYAQELRNFIWQHCAKTMIINPSEIWFKGTTQGTVMLLLEKKSHPDQHSLIKIRTVNNDEFLQQTPEQLFPEQDFIPQFEGKWVEALLSKDDLALYHRAIQHPDMHRMGEFAKASAAITTGANEFFVISEQEARQSELQPYCVPAFSKSHHCLGIIYDQPQHELNQVQQERVNLIKLDALSVDPPVLRHIAQAEAKGLHQRYKCRVRTPWFVVPEVKPQAACMNKFSHECPRLIVNDLKAYTTDGYYVVKVDPQIEVSALAGLFLNPVTMISAEMEGRFYGGGVLELMPSEISKLVVPYFQDARLYSAAELNLRVKQQGISRVVRENGQHILSLMGFSTLEIEQIFKIWQQLKDNRTRKN